MARMSKAERIAALKKQNGDISVATVKQYNVCPTRIPELNALLPGGYVKGKVNLAYGTPSSGKSTTAVECIADEMERDPDHVCLLIPSERGEDLPYYERLGMDMSRTMIMKKKHYVLEHVMDDVRQALEDELVDSVLIDSWDGLVGYKEMYTPDGKEKDVIKEAPGAKAYGGDKMWKRVKGLIADRNVLFLIVAQIRVHGLGGYITTEDFSGGNALKHNCDVVVCQNLLRLVKEKIDGRDTAVGQEVRITLKKSKVNANVHKSAEVVYRYGSSWDQVQGIWNMAVNRGIIVKNGGWYNYPGFAAGKNGKTQIQGELPAKEFFQDDVNRLKLQVLVDYSEENPQFTEQDIIRIFNSDKEIDNEPKEEEEY